MRSPEEIIKRPLLTEKGTRLKETGGNPEQGDGALDPETLKAQLLFEVARDANKVEIRRAIEKLLGARVDTIRTAIAHGKIKRQGRFAGQRPDWKKAYVTLRAGEKLPDFLEGA